MFMLVGPVAKAVNGLLAIQAFRPDRITSMARVFVDKVLGTNFLHTAEKELNLASIVENEVWCLQNVCFCKLDILLLSNGRVVY